ncbi:unnamed protein product [Vitrella brassicaformis CCMP3155]|uniref:t-SNARE coiled-coil homology domain-containing protein n=2 Tax=Vitrella brassicaformis TaxID=1169539 RepID=A0A0G4FDD9_VITBC|nr:unnamed protein product [Vitrella brassicaformis CCMP3155]|mmetsp:Transcript_36822/g.92284  ORF Transcript_36822/g.92284 Transcript_36822/m.92284 type:complete len:322 (+) Transcript_36822:110-1075(+)|eukprot:CEM11249.1 unnamed protein product [Vitrella brassicaformis CCMP3155]
MVCGPTRNITSIYIKYRSDHKNKKNRFGISLLGGGSPSHAEAGQQRLLASTSEEDIQEVEMTQLPPVWVDLIEDAQDDIQKIKDKIATLQQKQQRRLLKVFGEEGSNTSLESEIDNLSHVITALFRQCEGRIHQIQTRGTEMGVTNKEYALRQNAQRSVANQLQKLSQDFRKQQKNYLQELKKRQSGGREIFESASESTTDDFGFSESQVNELETIETDVNARNQEIAHIAQSVADLHNIFKELAVLVIDQGTMLDRIDYNVEQVVMQTEEANVHIAKAEKLQKSGRAMKCILALVIAIFVMLGLLILKHTGHRRLQMADD